mgnify:CR=1 FL=1
MLTVYRASAGAGKTHKLTGEYLTLLFTGPGAFRRILAVTFTNKATDEMKTRIVDELYNLASGRKSDYVELLKSAYSLTVRAYMNDIFRISTVKNERGIDYPFARSVSMSLGLRF